MMEAVVQLDQALLCAMGGETKRRLVLLGSASLALLSIGLAFFFGGLELGVKVSGPLLAIVGLAVTLTGRSQSRESELSATSQLDLGRSLLAEEIAVRLREELRLRGLNSPDPIAVRWDRVEMASPTIALSYTSLTDVVQAYASFDNRRMVVLGSAGSGKTTLVMALMLEMLKKRDGCDPVPVLLPLPSWELSEYADVHEWIERHLVSNYRNLCSVNPELPRRMVDSRCLIPVFDGLDELPEERRSQVIRAINRSFESDEPLVLTSRPREYLEAQAMSGPIAGASYIKAEPVCVSAAVEYLNRSMQSNHYSGEWNGVFEHLRMSPDGPLAKVCATALGVWLLKVVYVDGRRDPAGLIDTERYPDDLSLLGHLFTNLVPTAVEIFEHGRKKGVLFEWRRSWGSEQTTRWLTGVAKYFARADLVTWWNSGSSSRIAPLNVLGSLLIGSLSGALGFTVLWSVKSLEGVRGPLSGGVVLGLAVVLAALLGSKDGPAYASLRRKRGGQRVHASVWTAFFLALSAGLLLIPIVGHQNGPGTLINRPYFLESWVRIVELTLVVSVFCWVLILPALAAIKWLERPSSLDREATWRATLRSARIFFLARCLIAGSVTSLSLFAIMFIVDHYYKRFDGLTIDDVINFAAFGVLLGLVVSVITGARAWLAYSGVRLLLAFGRRVPLRLTSFVEYAHALGLFRSLGASYQFRHISFQNQLSPSRVVGVKARNVTSGEESESRPRAAILSRILKGYKVARLPTRFLINSIGAICLLVIGSLLIISLSPVAITTVKGSRESYGVLLAPDGGLLAFEGPSKSNAILLSPDSKTLYVASAAINGVVSVDPSSGSRKGIVETGKNPTALDITPDGRTLFVTNADSNTMAVVDVSKGAVVTTVDTGVAPGNVAIDDKSKRVYVANFGSNDIVVFDMLTYSRIASIPVGSHPTGMTVTPDGARIYVVNSREGTVSILDSASDRVEGTIVLGTNADEIATSPDGSYVYVPKYDSNELAVIDVNLRRIVKVIPTRDSPNYFVKGKGAVFVNVMEENGGIERLNVEKGLIQAGISSESDGLAVSSAISNNGKIFYVLYTDNKTIGVYHWN